MYDPDDQQTLCSTDRAVHLFYIVIVSHGSFVRHRLIFTDRDVSRGVAAVLRSFFGKFMANKPTVLERDTLWTRYHDRLFHCGRSVTAERMLEFAENSDRAFCKATEKTIHELIGEKRMTQSFWIRFWRSNEKYRNTPYRITDYHELR